MTHAAHEPESKLLKQFLPGDKLCTSKVETQLVLNGSSRSSLLEVLAAVVCQSFAIDASHPCREVFRLRQKRLHNQFVETRNLRYFQPQRPRRVVRLG